MGLLSVGGRVGRVGFSLYKDHVKVLVFSAQSVRKYISRLLIFAVWNAQWESQALTAPILKPGRDNAVYSWFWILVNVCFLLIFSMSAPCDRCAIDPRDTIGAARTETDSAFFPFRDREDISEIIAWKTKHPVDISRILAAYIVLLLCLLI